MSTESSPDATDTAGQRRHLTMLFADLSDSMQLGELMEAEDYAQMLASLRLLCHRVVPRHGGHIARIQGDGVLAFWGYPEAREDDGRRATEAALELHAAVSALVVPGPAPGPLCMHSGLHAGQVYLSDGDVERGRFELVGNAPNVAARLSAMAARDDIVVSEETLGPHARFFMLGESESVAVKGRTAPLTVRRVLGRVAQGGTTDQPSRRLATPFVGRESELRWLRDHMRAAALAPGGCVVVQAAPGMGKTRLIEELVTRAASSALVLRGCCEGDAGTEPLLPFRQILRTLAHDDEAQGAPAAAPASLPPAAVAQRIARLAARQPLVIVLDDWQWADEASLLALRALQEQHLPIFVLLAMRSAAREPRSEAPGDSLVLGPLDAEAACTVASHLLPGADPFTLADIHRHAGGIPLYIEELCHAVRAHAGDWRSVLGRGGSAWLNGLIESRISRLDAATGELVRMAAVIGNVVPCWLLEQLLGRPLEAQVVGQLARHDLIYADERQGMLRFKHGVTRDVAYQSVGLRERRRLHRLAALALQQWQARAATGGPDTEPVDGPLEALAAHCAAAGMAVEAARTAESAADQAMAASALDRARYLYGAALKALDALGVERPDVAARWCAVAEKLGMASVFDVLGLDDGVTPFVRALELARRDGRDEAVARAAYWLGYVWYARGQAQRALPPCAIAVEHAMRTDDQRLLMQVRAMHAQALLAASRYAEAERGLELALEFKRRTARPGSSLAVGSAYTLACKGYLLGDQGRFDLAHECFEEALALVGSARHQVMSSVQHWRSLVLQWQGRWQESAEVAEISVDVAEYTRSRHQLAMGRALAGYSRWVLTRSAEALRRVVDATAWIEARQGGLVVSINYGWLVDGLLASGDTLGARRHAASLFVRARRADRLGEAMGCRALALAAAKVNDHSRAQHYLGRARHVAALRRSPHESAVNLLCEAQIAAGRGDTALARTLLDSAGASFDALAMPWHVQRVRFVAQRLL